FCRVRILLHHVLKFVLRERIHLVEEADRRLRIAATFALHLQLMTDLSGAEQNSSGIRNRRVDHYRSEPRNVTEIRQRTDCLRMPQHALWSKNNERLAPFPHRLTPQQMEVLRRGRRLRHLHVVASGKLKISLNSSARVFRTLAFVSMGKQEYK